MTIPKLPRFYPMLDGILTQAGYAVDLHPFDYGRSYGRYDYCDWCSPRTVWPREALVYGGPVGEAACPLHQWNDSQVCHCGKPIHVFADGFTRNLCLSCTHERCDAPQEGEIYSCQRPKADNPLAHGRFTFRGDIDD